jgi:hypothetical protein
MILPFLIMGAGIFLIVFYLLVGKILESRKDYFDIDDV